ncbi:MAG: tilS [Gammaproteobacteria bacterium]|jgi:tRNA(Ile)-lysidine synthase|nr:tilS [Gammaproteobacteria bacterium]
MASPVKAIETFCLKQGIDKTYWIAYSGGLDSHVLLHLCATLRQQYPLKFKAVHVNHSLSVHAPHWALHCEKICADLNIELIYKIINAKASEGDSPENIARHYRYQLFSELLGPNSILLTAHQQDDQAETVLIQLLRGAGPKGLSAMPLLKLFAAGFHGRPLLHLSRAELKNYAEEHQLKWIQDESNENKNFTRNFLRHDILPLLKNRWPTVTKTLARVAENCAEAQEIIEHTAEKGLTACCGKQNQTLSVKKLLLLAAMHQRQVLRAWLVKLQFPLPSAAKLRQIQQDFLHAKQDKSPYMHLDTFEIRRYRDDMYAMRCLPKWDPKQIFVWELSQPLMIPSLGKLHAVSTDTSGLRADIKNVTVRFRQGGERCYFPERQCHYLLKHLFQEWGVPPWKRDRLPLLYVEEELIGVVGFFLNSNYKSTTGFQIKLILI